MMGSVKTLVLECFWRFLFNSVEKVIRSDIIYIIERM